MQANRLIAGTIILAMPVFVPALVDAQGRGGRTGGPNVAFTAARPLEILNVEQGDIPAIANAPFTAEASTEFTQTLGDGNRIDRRFTTSLARDSRGRTRREQEVAMIGPMFVMHVGGAGAQEFSVRMPGAQGTSVTSHGEPPRFVLIADPADNVTYTLDEESKSARRTHMASPLVVTRAHELNKVEARVTAARSALELASEAVTESLGTRQFEGVTAQGTRSTTTIPAGQIGNLLPIAVVTERWFSQELQMAVLITRRDPRSGDTVYRLTNIVRTEPPPDLFTVPPDYRVVDVQRMRDENLTIEMKKLEEEARRARPQR
jgi:hypothetical protein